MLLASSLVSFGNALENSSFEEEFGPREDLNMWGDMGETFGETYQVSVDAKNRPETARTGKRVLLINVPQNTWNGLWQQVPWEPDMSYVFKAYYLIRDRDLEGSTATFMKVEFYDALDNKIGEERGRPRAARTKGTWLLDSLRGTTPPNTASIRCVLIAGNNPGGPMVMDQLFWDNASLTK